SSIGPRGDVMVQEAVPLGVHRGNGNFAVPSGVPTPQQVLSSPTWSLTDAPTNNCGPATPARERVRGRACVAIAFAHNWFRPEGLDQPGTSSCWRVPHRRSGPGDRPGQADPSWSGDGHLPRPASAEPAAAAP